MRRSGSASIGANLSASAMTALSSRASRSTAMLPPGVAVVSMRPLRLERRIAEICDRQPLDLDAAGVELQLRRRVARLEPGDARAADLEPQRDLARPLQPQSGERAVGETEQRVEIDLTGLQIGIEPRRTSRRRPRISQPAFDHAAIELGAQLLDRDAVGAERDVAAQLPRLELTPAPRRQTGPPATRSAPSDRWRRCLPSRQSQSPSPTNRAVR